MSRPEDNVALFGLATLDSATVPPAPLLVGEVQGSLAAALSLATGEVIADPFRRTAALVELLRLRARQLTKQDRTEDLQAGGGRRLRSRLWGSRRQWRRRVPALS